MNLTKSSVIGGASVGGLYLARMLRGSSGSLSLGQTAMVFGVSMASAYVTPSICSMAMCPHSPGFPIAEAAVSSGLSWGGLYVGGANQNATMFIPVQTAAYLAGNYLYDYMYPANEEESA